ncbi:DUF1554 domain-containing protein [Leptospira bourretii]|uniref:DUF1554 domain-containing protein n=1 Tax=Leptospira bourretii TaxID=2484962 RepID=UPI001091208B|nr:DUF1554 domain-containing protein [Leptospira bourretii]TGL26309.1 DUF1554 domain-containing protein [Leptospira bourretii]
MACASANCATGGTAGQTDWVLKPNKEYRRIDGATVIGTTNANGIFAADLTNEISTTISGTSTIATGLNSNWTESANDCSNFTETPQEMFPMAITLINQRQFYLQWVTAGVTALGNWFVWNNKKVTIFFSHS